MATTMFSCGCSITRSMFGNREILDVHFCIHHAVNEEVQLMLKTLCGLSHKMQDDDPGRWDEYSGTYKFGLD